MRQNYAIIQKINQNFYDEFFNPIHDDVLGSASSYLGICLERNRFVEMRKKQSTWMVCPNFDFEHRRNFADCLFSLVQEEIIKGTAANK